MGRLHQRLTEHGQFALRLEAQSQEERRLVDTAARFLGDENTEPAFSHPGLCLSIANITACHMVRRHVSSFSIYKQKP